MFEPVISFVLKYKFIFLFYLVILILVIWKRKYLAFQAKVIILYRMKFGLKFIEKFSTKHRHLVVLLGYIGVGAGFIGLVAISYVMLRNLWDLFTQPAAVSGVSLVLPGINVPGLGVLPFWYWILAIFCIALIHEFSHGIVARANDIKVKNTGIVLFGPIIGAFVEPDEKNMAKQSDIKNYSVLAAGSFSNMLLAMVALLMLTFIFAPIQATMVEPAGWSFSDYYGEDLPAEAAGLPTGTVISSLNGEETEDFVAVNDRLNCMVPGDEVTFSTTEGNYTMILAANPDYPDKPFIGVSTIKNEFNTLEKYSSGFWGGVYYIIAWISGFLKWLFILSLGIGLFNLLPLPIVDGGRMLQVYLHRLKGKIKGEYYYRKITMFFLLVLVINLLYPLLKGLF